MLKAQVTIIGGGPTGLMLGCLLLQQGIESIIIEKSISISQDTKALMIHARSLEILNSLDVVASLLKIGIRTQYLSFHIYKVKTFKFSFEDLDTQYPFYLILPQPEVEKILQEKYLSLGGTIYRGEKFLGLTQYDSHVNSTIERANREEILTSDYLVGCDGASSSVRNCLSIPFEGITYDMDYILADGVLKEELPRNEAAMYITPNGVLSVLPFSNNKFRVAGPGIGKSFLNEGEKLSVERFNKMLEQIGLYKLLQMEHYDRVTNYKVNERLVPALKFGRVFLAGDSAHIHSPAGGQAMNVGFQDVHNLSWKLAHVLKGKAPLRLLETYHSERYPVIKEAIKTANFFGFIEAMKKAKSKEDIQMVHQNGKELVKKLSQLYVDDGNHL